MKKIKTITAIILVLLLISFCGCQSESGRRKKETNETNGYKTVVIDSCEYITTYIYRGEALCHKGNCKFCAERNKKVVR